MSWCRTLSREFSEFDTAHLSIHKAVAWKARGIRVSVVNANWNGNRWNRNRNPLDNSNVWNRENRLVVRNSQLSPRFLILLKARGFLFTVVFPSHEHFARFDEIFRELRILRVCEHFHFPSDTEKEFCEVEARESCFDGSYLSFSL